MIPAWSSFVTEVIGPPRKIRRLGGHFSPQKEGGGSDGGLAENTSTITGVTRTLAAFDTSEGALIFPGWPDRRARTAVKRRTVERDVAPHWPPIALHASRRHLQPPPPSRRARFRRANFAPQKEPRGPASKFPAGTRECAREGSVLGVIFSPQKRAVVPTWSVPKRNSGHAVLQQTDAACTENW